MYSITPYDHISTMFPWRASSLFDVLRSTIGDGGLTVDGDGVKVDGASDFELDRHGGEVESMGEGCCSGGVGKYGCGEDDAGGAQRLREKIWACGLKMGSFCFEEALTVLGFKPLSG